MKTSGFIAFNGLFSNINKNKALISSTQKTRREKDGDKRLTEG